jgi:hypothetical protein
MAQHKALVLFKLNSHAKMTPDRQLPVQEQLGESRQTRKGETAKLDEPLTQNRHQPASVLNGNPGQISAEIDTRRISPTSKNLLAAVPRAPHFSHDSA